MGGAGRAAGQRTPARAGRGVAGRRIAAAPSGSAVTPARYHRHVPAFEVVSPFRPAGDQPEAIAGLVAGLERGDRYQTLLGITGSGKTATIAWTIEAVQRPTLIIEPNKSLAAQLAAELKEFFPRNRVEYFVSYYDYYQPEAYVPSSDTYIEKDSSINDEIDRLRHACTSSLLLRPDTIVVASVSLHLRAGLARGVPRPHRGPPARRGARPAVPAPAADRTAVLAQRRQPDPRPVPGPRGHRSRSTPPTRARPSASSSSATPSSASGPST